MGRTVKRVPLDFDWPLDKTWSGYVNPWYEFCKNCKECDGSGLSPAAKTLSDQWYGNAPFDAAAYGAVPLAIDDKYLRQSIEAKLRRSQEIADEDGKQEWYTQGGTIPFEAAVKTEIHRMWRHYRFQWCHHLIQSDVDALVAAGRLMDFTHRPINQEQAKSLIIQKESGGSGYWLDSPNGTNPTAEEVNRWSLGGLSHDSINAGVCLRARCERESVTMDCAACNGSGSVWSPADAEQKSDEWVETEPPVGDGYQIWETVSEGSAISPVFSTPEDLATHMTTTRWGGDRGTSYETWLEFIRGPGWAPSMVMIDGKVMSGVSGVVEMAKAP